MHHPLAFARRHDSGARFVRALGTLLLLLGGCAEGGGGVFDAGRLDAARPDAGQECLGTLCGDACVDLQSESEHCGGCGMACGEGNRCRDGACERDPCARGLYECGGQCVDLTSDAAHCAACNSPCGAGESCFGGACGPTTCPAGTTRCGAGCVDLRTDEAHCGACGSACAATEECVDGVCEDSCPAPGLRCTTEEGSVLCEDAASDPSNCGGCDIACAALESCADGTCSCAAPNRVCGGVCTDVRTSHGNCGSCGNVCGPEQLCVDGACACPTGFSLCGGSCTNALIDNSNCGACGRTCATPAESCTGGTCVASCGAGMVVCGGLCTDIATNASHCGACGNVCASGTSCRAGVCAPSNDDRVNAIAITLGNAEVVVNGTTAGATNDGPTVACGCSSGPNVWYRFTLAERSVVYFDTAGSGSDTSLFLTDSTGALVPAQAGNGFSNPGLCNDDAGCSTGGFTRTVESRLAGVLAAGTYYIAVGGCSTGAFTLRGQRIPTNVGYYFYESRLQGDGTASTVLVGSNVTSSTCGGTGSGEDVRWILSCGAQPQLFSLCTSDGGSFTRRSGTSTFYDPVLYLRSAQTGTDVACNDDGGSAGGTACVGTAPAPAVSGDSSSYGSRLNDVVAPRGISAVFVDERLQSSGMNYTLRYIVR